MTNGAMNSLRDEIALYGGDAGQAAVFLDFETLALGAGTELEGTSDPLSDAALA